MRASLNKLLLQDTAYEYKWEGTYIYNPEAYDEDPTTGIMSYTVFTDSMFRDIIRNLYGERVYNDYDESSIRISDVLVNFKQAVSIWISSRDQEIGPLMYALSLKYNPIENYRSTETRQGLVKDGTTDTLEFTNRKDVETDDSYTEHTFTNYKETEKIDESTTTGYGSGDSAYKESFSYGEQTRTNKISADDATDFSNQSQEIDALHTDSKKIENDIVASRATGQNGNTKEISGSWKDAHGIPQGGLGHVLEKFGVETSRKGGQIEDSYTLERFGNIGVTTSQQMVLSSYDLAARSIVYIMLKEFVELYTYISEEVD